MNGDAHRQTLASNNWLSAQFTKYLQVKNMNEPVYY